jgi:hypothetical protein
MEGDRWRLRTNHSVAKVVKVEADRLLLEMEDGSGTVPVNIGTIHGPLMHDRSV